MVRIRLAEVGAPKVGIDEAGIAEGGFAQRRSAELRIGEVAADEARARERGFRLVAVVHAEHGAGEVGPAEIRPVEQAHNLGASEVGGCKARRLLAHDLQRRKNGRTQDVGAGKIGTREVGSGHDGPVEPCP